MDRYNLMCSIFDFRSWNILGDFLDHIKIA